MVDIFVGLAEVLNKLHFHLSQGLLYVFNDLFDVVELRELLDELNIVQSGQPNL